MSLAVVLVAFVVVFPVELPDKTLVATLVLTTRYRPRPVLLGVVAAFAVQVVIAVAFGQLLSLLPDRVVAGGVAVLFAGGAILLLREGFGVDEDAEADAGVQRGRLSSWRISLTSFGVIFAAEWGDASQLAVAALAARYRDPLSVGVGAWLALALVAAVAVVIGAKIAGRIAVRLIQRVAGFAFAAFAVVAVVELVRS